MARRALNLIALITAVLGISVMAPAVHAANATRTSSFEYDPATGLLTKEIIEPNDSNLCLVTEYTYDVYGNKTAVTTRNCNGSTGEAATPTGDAVIAARTTSSTFDARGQFAVTTTNALGHSETRTFDARFGAVASLTGPNGLTTAWSYDNFGRKTLETRADTTTTEWLYKQPCDVANADLAEAYCVATKNSGEASYQRTYYDTLNRKLGTVRIAYSGSDLAGTQKIVDGKVDYDGRGHVTRGYLPYFAGNLLTAKYASFTYDDLGRVTSETAPDGRYTTSSYNGLTTTVTMSAPADPSVTAQTKTTVKNSQGQTITVTDAKNQSINYTYDPFGNLTQTTDAAGNLTKLGYDGRGRKTRMEDPDMGVWTYAYNALGELIRQVDAKNQTVTMQYDKLGRMTRRNEPSMIANWAYDTAAHGIGKLASATVGDVAPYAYSRTHSYDALGRLSSTSTIIDKPANPYVTSTTYDANGRVDTQTYPTGFAVKNIYNADGYLYRVVNAATQTTVYWTANTMDEAGRLTQQTYGNNVVTTQVYDPASGRLTNQYAGGGNAVQNMQYGYDGLGNLISRLDINQNLTEGFWYDELNRITTATTSSGGVSTMTTFAYDAIGNITCKSDISACSATTPNYTYNARVTSGGITRTLPHAVGQITGTINYYFNPAFTYDANGNLTSGAGRSITWNSFNMPGQITFNFKTTSFWYSSEHERIKEHQADGSDVITLSPRYDTGLHFEKKYIANFGMLTGAVEYEHYLYAGGLMFGKYITTTTTNGVTIASTKVEYYTKDHLGSIVAITDEAGTVTQSLSYDVWGKRRNLNGTAGANGQFNNADMYHGFTGHEMLDAVGLIHMNGRLFDPLLGRFVSADMNIQAPFNLQSYNRYTYCWDNPMTCTDPSGYFLEGLIDIPFIDNAWNNHIRPAISDTWHQVWRSDIGQAAIQVVIAYFGGPEAVAAYNGAYTKYQGGSWNDSFKAATITYVNSVGFGGVGDATGHNPVFGSVQYAQNIAGHALVGCANAVASGADCGNGAMAAGFGAAVTPWVRENLQGVGKLVAVSVVGGTASVVGGGRFANGAVTAAFGYLYNECMGKDCKLFDGMKLDPTLGPASNQSWVDDKGVVHYASLNDVQRQPQCATGACASGIPQPIANLSFTEQVEGTCRLACNIAMMPLTVGVPGPVKIAVSVSGVRAKLCKEGCKE
ncbi:MAG TPA: RHS repeat-associated core domain-containing protein [Gallionella sp.]|nr:RHS repeat-associated core domain-containing protein [Gallionella sp.]